MLNYHAFQRQNSSILPQMSKRKKNIRESFRTNGIVVVVGIGVKERKNRTKVQLEQWTTMENPHFISSHHPGTYKIGLVTHTTCTYLLFVSFCYRSGRCWVHRLGIFHHPTPSSGPLPLISERRPNNKYSRTYRPCHLSPWNHRTGRTTRMEPGTGRSVMVSAHYISWIIYDPHSFNMTRKSNPVLDWSGWADGPPYSSDVSLALFPGETNEGMMQTVEHGRVAY